MTLVREDALIEIADWKFLREDNLDLKWTKPFVDSTKFGQICNKFNVNDSCKETNCEDSHCKKRHPKACK